MITSHIFEHKTEYGLGAISCGIGAFVGSKVYKSMPSDLVKSVYKNGKQQDDITNKFIDCVVKSYKKDLYSKVETNTPKDWYKKQIETMKASANSAKADPANKWTFQKIYDLGVDFLNGKKIINSEDTGLAKRGANAILYGRKVQKAKTVLTGAILACGIFALGDLAVKKFKNNKHEKDLK